MMDCDSHYERVCKDEFASINVKLDRLDEAIRGNGKLGIQNRLTTLEATEATRSRMLWIVVTASIVLAVGGIWKMVFDG
jgi:hypothetical protein